LGSILKLLKITTKSLRRSKKGFLIFINVFFNIFKKLPKTSLSLFFNFFDYKLILFKKKFFKLNFNNLLIFKVYNFINKSLFKKSRSIKRRLTKKFIKNSI